MFGWGVQFCPEVSRTAITSRYESCWNNAGLLSVHQEVVHSRTNAARSFFIKQQSVTFDYLLLARRKLVSLRKPEVALAGSAARRFLNGWIVLLWSVASCLPLLCSSFKQPIFFSPMPFTGSLRHSLRFTLGELVTAVIFFFFFLLAGEHQFFFVVDRPSSLSDKISAWCVWAGHRRSSVLPAIFPERTMASCVDTC